MQKGKFETVDNEYLSQRKKLAETINIPHLFDIVDHFGLYSGTQTIGRTLAVYEIFQQTLQIPGDIVEFGCWKGSNLLLMAKMSQLLQPNSIKQVYGFDSFEGLRTFSSEDGIGTKEIFENRYQGDQSILREFIRLHKMESWVKLIVGDALKTIDQFDKENAHTMFSLAFIDFDLYQPCLKALDFSAERLSVGGLIVLDEALTDTWKGEGQALREFLNKRKGNYKMRSNEISRQPTVILEKIK